MLARQVDDESGVSILAGTEKEAQLSIIMMTWWQWLPSQDLHNFDSRD